MRPYRRRRGSKRARQPARDHEGGILVSLRHFCRPDTTCYGAEHAPEDDGWAAVALREWRPEERAGGEADDGGRDGVGELNGCFVVEGGLDDEAGLVGQGLGEADERCERDETEGAELLPQMPFKGACWIVGWLRHKDDAAGGLLRRCALVALRLWFHTKFDFRLDCHGFFDCWQRAKRTRQGGKGIIGE